MNINFFPLCILFYRQPRTPCAVAQADSAVKSLHGGPISALTTRLRYMMTRALVARVRTWSISSSGPGGTWSVVWVSVINTTDDLFFLACNNESNLVIKKK